jgi:hypothetical protein
MAKINRSQSGSSRALVREVTLGRLATEGATWSERRGTEVAADFDRVGRGRLGEGLG